MKATFPIIPLDPDKRAAIPRSTVIRRNHINHLDHLDDAEARILDEITHILINEATETKGTA